MGTQYRSGLRAFKKSGFDPKVGDTSVRGIDRKPAKLLEEATIILSAEGLQQHR